MMIAALMLIAATPAVAAPATAATFRDCPDCPEMKPLPTGSYLMGTAPAEAERLGIAPTSRTLPWQQPQHRVTIARPVAFATTPVTRAQYALFARAVGEKAAGSDWAEPGIKQTDQDPVVRVSWRHALAYAAWLATRTGKPYRLPSEAEWEYAARGGTTTAYWWGDDAGVNHTVCDDCGSEWDGKGTAPVGHFPPNPFGLYDMLGQVFEWNADCWNGNYVGAPADGSPWSTGDCTQHPSRGGSWNLDARISRSGQRSRDGDDYEGNMVGFRVVRDLP